MNCPQCGGKGYDYLGTYQRKCHFCGGTGKVTECRKCSAMGYILVRTAHAATEAELTPEPNDLVVLVSSRPARAAEDVHENTTG
jgi:DnaJ-class molecular chaperone